MSAHIIDFASAAARMRKRVSPKPKSTAAALGLAHDFKFWTGASGKRYVHTLFGLIDCPEVGHANVLLVRADGHGKREVVHVGRLEQAPSVNLAEIRKLGATLGANEVYLHLLADSPMQRRFIEIDLQAALAGAEQTRAS